MPIIKEDKTLLIRCACHYHVLEVTHDEDWFENASHSGFNISIWNQSPTPINFRERLKMIWKLIRFKNLDAGDVIITKDDAKILTNFLTKKLGEKKHGKQKSNKTDTTRRSS